MARRILTPEQESWLFSHFPNMTNKELAEKLTDMLREENQRQLAQAEHFTFHSVSGLEGFEEVLHNIQTCTAFVAVSDISQGYTELNNTPHTRRVKTVFLAMRHDEKFLLINQAFQSKQRLMPFFNRQNNDDLILATQSAGVTRGRNGFHKNKAGEKLAETEENLLEHRTDGSDAFDTLYIGAEKFPQTETSFVSVSGVS